MRRSPMWAVIPAAAALAAAGARWLVQGSGNVWSDADRRFYLPDPDLGWRLGAREVPWLGLDLLAVIAGVVAVVTLAAWLVARCERRRGAPWRPARVVLWVVAALPLVPPLYAFARGGRPAGGRDRLPSGASIEVADGISGGVAAPAGVYTVRAPSTLVASVRAGGERFDVRFGAVTGSWRGDPRDLGQPMAASLSARAREVDTGIDLRSEHTRQYLQADKFPDVGLALTRLVGARAEGAGVAYRADATLELMGERVPVAVSGTLRAADAAARERLAVTGAALLLTAEFKLDLRNTPLRSKLGDFDSPEVTVSASLVLVNPRSPE